MKIKQKNDESVLRKIIDIYQQYHGIQDVNITKLPISGSSRQYFRITGNKSIIATYNEDKKENRAFIEYSKHFKSKKLSVPEIYKYFEDDFIYFQEDLGDETLFNRIKKFDSQSRFNNENLNLYKCVLEKLAEIQFRGGEGLNYELAYPRSDFDKQSVMWDLNYFKYFFLKLAHASFDEQLLENDFNYFANFLLQADCSFFLFRDFQSRNIMLKDGKIFFIDYQGGRRGALQYDVASLLYDAKAEIPNDLREKLAEHYINNAKKHKNFDENSFRKYYYAYALIRILQAMGAYGYRGFYERKVHFIESIKPALENLKYVMKQCNFLDKIPHLKKVLEALPENKNLLKATESNRLIITVRSFSYKRGFPYDKSGNGGGFIFDCRFMENPGRHDEYKSLTGKDLPVINFLEEKGEAKVFLNNIYKIISPVIEKYIERGFSSLSIDFGCTGGQHRSVYCAEKTSEFIKENYNVKLIISHTEQEKI